MLNFYIHSSFHVALSVLCFTYLSYLELHIPASNRVLGFVFFATIVGYNFAKYLGFHSLFEKNNPIWLRTIAVFSFFAMVMLLKFVKDFQNNSIILISFLGLLTFFYAMPISLKNARKISLRGLSGLKVFIIAFVWTVTTIVLPVIEYQTFDLPNLVPMVVQRFLWILVLMIPFEIRDLKYDHESLGTWPQRFGVERTKVLGFFMLAVIIALEAIKSSDYKLNFRILTIVVFVCGGLVWGAGKKRSIYYSAFWVESLPIFWLILVLMFS